MTTPAPIDSLQNPRFKTWRKLASAKGVDREGLALVAGPRIVRERLREDPDRVAAVLVSGETPAPEGADPARVVALSPELFRELDQFGTHAPLAVVQVDPLPAWTRPDQPEGLTLYIPFQDPENVGAVVRSAVGFGVDTIVLLAEAAHPFLPKTIRASGGTVFSAPLQRGPALADLVPGEHDLVLSGEGRPLGEVEFPAAGGLVLGLEGPGVPEAWRSRSVAIPLRPGVESLNAAAATAVALYAWTTHRGEAG